MPVKKLVAGGPGGRWRAAADRERTVRRTSSASSATATETTKRRSGIVVAGMFNKPLHDKELGWRDIWFVRSTALYTKHELSIQQRERGKAPCLQAGVHHGTWTHEMLLDHRGQRAIPCLICKRGPVSKRGEKSIRHAPSSQRETGELVLAFPQMTKAMSCHTSAGIRSAI